MIEEGCCPDCPFRNAPRAPVRSKDGTLSYDPMTQDLACAGRSVHLRRQVGAIAARLIANEGSVVRYDALVSEIMRFSGSEDTSGEHLLPVLTSQLRRALRSIGAPFQIKTSFLVGYAFGPGESESKSNKRKKSLFASFSSEKEDVTHAA